MKTDHNKKNCLETLRRLQGQTQAAISAVEMGELVMTKKPLCADGYDRSTKNTFTVGDFVIVDRNVDPKF